MINLLSKRYDMFCKIQKTLLLLLIGFTVSSSAKDFLLVKDGTEKKSNSQKSVYTKNLLD